MLSFKKNKLVSGSIIALFTAILVSLGSYMGAFVKLEFMAFDIRAKLFSKYRLPSDDIAIILIDEASLRQMNPVVGRWPWPRSLHADLVDFLSLGGARAVVFDIIFPENERVPGASLTRVGPNDARLAEATKSAGNTYHAAQLIVDTEDEYNKGLLDKPLPSDFVDMFAIKGLKSVEAMPNNNYYLPIPELYRAAKGIGIVEFPPDSDGKYRRTRLFRNYHDSAFPVLSVAPIVERLDRGGVRMEKDKLVLSGSAHWKGSSIPVQRDGSYLINMCGGFRPYSMSGVLASAQKIKLGELEGLPVNPEDFKNKVVFIGASAVGVEDLKSTSIGNNTPGVYLHASIYSNIVRNDFLSHTSPRVTVFSIFALSIAVVIAILWTRSIFYQIAIPVSLVFVYVLTSFWWFRYNVVYDIVGPVFSAVFSWMAAFAYLSFTEGKDKRKIKRMLGQYVSPAILTTVMDKGSKDVLTAEVGSRERLTILFSDIRGFTSISEAVEAEKVVELLNGYLSGMVDVIFRHEGTLDKFIGDAIMAFWGAPVRVDDHGRRAVTAALEMIEQLKIFNESIKDKGLPAIAIGVGINTGEVILGNIGSEKKLDYTVIGDNVNLASRMEGLTKEYGCPVLLTESTYHEIRDEIPCRIVDMVRVKGKHQPVRIYEPVASPQNAARVVSLTEEGFNAYLNREWEKAKDLYSELMKLKEGDHLAGVFIGRCESYIENVPPVEWDGVYTMTKK